MVKKIDFIMIAGNTFERKQSLKNKRSRKPRYHLNWNGREEHREDLERAAKRVKEEGSKLSYLDNTSYFNGAVKSMKGLPCNPVFTDLGAAYRDLNDLTRKLVEKEKIDIDLIRTITAPIMADGNQREITLVEERMNVLRMEV